MVKNLGGKRTKGLARKTYQSNNHFDIKLRLPTSPEEKYAVVRKLYGNSCSVLCDDSKERLAMISGKFSRRSNKRNNFIAPGTVILIGLREWATVVEGKIEKCDILEIYSLQELDQLKQRPNFPTHFIDTSINDLSGETNTPDAFVFSSVEENNILSNESSDNVVLMDTGEEGDIDIDDI